MPNLIDSALRVLDALEQKAHANRNHVGHWHDKLPDIQESVEERREARCHELNELLKASITPKQKHLANERDIQNSAYNKYTSGKSNPDSLPDDEEKEWILACAKAERDYLISLTPQQRAWRDEYNYLSGLSSSFDDGTTVPYHTIIEFPALPDHAITNPKEAAAIAEVLEAALERSTPHPKTFTFGLGDKPGSWVVKTDQETVSDLDIKKLRENLDGPVRRQLAGFHGEKRWKPVRSTRGTTYEYETPMIERDVTTRVLEALRDNDPDGSIRSGLRCGEWLEWTNDLAQMEEIMVEQHGRKIGVTKGDVSKVMRVHGADIQNVLVDMLGVKGLSVPIEKGRQ